MAKATSKEKGGASARARMARTSLSADAAHVRAPADDEPRDEEVELAGASETIEDDDESLRLDPPAFQGGGAGGAVAQVPAARTTPHSLTVPEPLMRNPFTRFIAESYIELRKVTWPSRHDAWNMTLIVVAMSAVVAIILGVADIGFTQALTWILNLGTGTPGR